MRSTRFIVEKELRIEEKPKYKLTSYIKSNIVWLEIAIKDATKAKNERQSGTHVSFGAKKQ
jgi:hypothetical protein